MRHYGGTTPFFNLYSAQAHKTHATKKQKQQLSCRSVPDVLAPLYIAQNKNFLCASVSGAQIEMCAIHNFQFQNLFPFSEAPFGMGLLWWQQRGFTVS